MDRLYINVIGVVGSKFLLIKAGNTVQKVIEQINSVCSQMDRRICNNTKVTNAGKLLMNDLNYALNKVNSIAQYTEDYSNKYYATESALNNSVASMMSVQKKNVMQVNATLFTKTEAISSVEQLAKHESINQNEGWFNDVTSVSNQQKPLKIPETIAYWKWEKEHEPEKYYDYSTAHIRQLLLQAIPDPVLLDRNGGSKLYTESIEYFRSVRAEVVNANLDIEYWKKVKIELKNLYFGAKMVDDAAMRELDLLLESKEKAKQFKMCFLSNDNIISSPNTWPKWGKEAGTITALEYAFLAEASYLNSKEEVYRFLRRQNFPEGHPFSTIRKDQIQYYDSEPQTLIIKLDSQNAIVVFAGTETLGDIFADTSFISVDNPSLQFRKQWANRIVQRLNSQGISHIVVAGHSLGGYLAVDVAMNNTTVKECVNFDGPGHRSDEIQSMTRHQVERIYNIANAWSPINMPLDQVGQTIKLELDTDYNNWASFIPNHAMQGIIHALGGYEYGTVK